MRRSPFSRRDRAPEADDVGPIPSSTLTRWLRQGIELHMCPLCRVAHKADREYIWQFSEEGFGNEETATAGSLAEKFSTSPGMCFPHFQLVWASGGTSQVRELILDVQRGAVAEVLDDLREFIRKEEAEFKHEPRAKEQDAWRRAIRLTVGWPAPEESASVPEARPRQAG